MTQITKRTKKPKPLPTWDDARHLLNQFKGHALMTVAAKVCLGMTLQQLKEKEGYTQGRHTQEGKPTWPELLMQELNISEPTARRFITAADAVKPKIAKLGGGPRLIGLLNQPLQSLSITDAKKLQDAIRTATDGESLTSLLQEFKLIKCPPPPPPDPSKGGSASRTKANEMQLAWDFAGGSVITELSKLRSGSNFKHALHTLPLSATDDIKLGLIDYVAELRASYEEADAVLKARMKS
jgi:hypothetical protein